MTNPQHTINETKATTIMNNVYLARIKIFASLLYVLATGTVPNLSCYAADTILDTAGFEGYNTGQLAGQLSGSKSWTTIGTGGGTASVDASVGIDGSMGIQLDRAGRSDDWWTVSYSGDNLPNNRYVLIDWDMKVDNVAAGDAPFGPFFGIETYDDSTDLLLLGTVGVDATTRDVLTISPDTGALTETGSVVDDDWHHYQIRLDFAEHVYWTSLDNVALVSQPIAFVDGVTDTFTDADIAAYAAGSDDASQILTATAYFDNLTIVDTNDLPIVQLIGDYNGNGSVDAADYTVWKDNFGSNTALAADGNLNGVVDAADYTIWKDNFGFAAAANLAIAVPEPAALCMITTILTMVCLLRRRTRMY